MRDIILCMSYIYRYMFINSKREIIMKIEVVPAASGFSFFP